ncbi:MAG: PHB depolymerase family esterase [Mycobacterium sp.]
MTAPESMSTVRADVAAAPPQPRLAWSGPYLFVSRAGRRPYYVYTPTGYRVGTSVPLVVMLHGCSQTPHGVAVATQWNELAEEHNFIVAYPGQTLAVHPGAITGSNGEPGDQPADDAAGASSSTQLDPCWRDGNGDNCWNWFLPDHQSRGAGEPAIIAGITRAVLADTAQWTIDPARVYVAGMSAGGAMAVILGATYPDLYSAVAAHSALEYKAATDIPSAFAALTQGGPNPVGQGQQAFAAMGDHARLMPVLVVQGTKDLRVNPVNGDQVIQQWLETNRLATGGMFTRQFATPTTDTHFNEATPGGHPYRVRTWNDNHAKIIHEY